jgi:effector-binding domain-containing protein
MTYITYFRFEYSRDEEKINSYINELLNKINNDEIEYNNKVLCNKHCIDRLITG